MATERCVFDLIKEELAHKLAKALKIDTSKWRFEVVHIPHGGYEMRFHQKDAESLGYTPFTGSLSFKFDDAIAFLKLGLKNRWLIEPPKKGT